MDRFGFDPNSRPARHLARNVQAREIVQVEIARRMTPEDARQADPRLLPMRTYGPGDAMTLQRYMAERLVSAGFAKRFVKPS